MDRTLGAQVSRLAQPVWRSQRAQLPGAALTFDVQVASGEKIPADETVLTADYGYAMKHLVPPGVQKKYSPEKVDSGEYSCSAFMLHLGLEKAHDLPHHASFFAGDYRKNLSDIFPTKQSGERCVRHKDILMLNITFLSCTQVNGRGRSLAASAFEWEMTTWGRLAWGSKDERVCHSDSSIAFRPALTIFAR